LHDGGPAPPRLAYWGGSLARLESLTDGGAFFVWRVPTTQSGHGVTTVSIYSVYFMKSDFFSDGVKGYDWLKQNNRVPKITDLNTSHVHLIDVEAEKLEDVYFKMQGESWSPTERVG
jgi:hypothetical protein